MVRFTRRDSVVAGILTIFDLNRRKNFDIYRNLPQQSKPGHDNRIETYVDLSARTESFATGELCIDVWIRFGFDREFVLSVHIYYI